MKKHSHLKTKYILAFMSRCPLAVAVIVSIFVMTILGAGYTLVKGELPKLEEDRPLFASLFVGGTSSDNSDDEDNPYEFETEEDFEIPELPTEEPVTNENGEVETKAEPETYVTEFVKKKKVKTDSPYFYDPGLTALTTDYPYSEVGDEYFDDALFIGDSRIEGMKLYSSLSNATYWSKEGTTIYKILSEKIGEAKVDGKKKTMSVQRALKNSSFGKVYIMLGINELGYKTTEEFAEKYRDVVDKIHRLQPKATIYLMAIMKVTAEKNKDEVYNNVNINAKNVAIAQIAADDGGKTFFYLDVNESVEDKDGNLKEKYSWDGIHLQSQYYERVVNYLKKHAVVNKTEERKDEEKTTEKSTEKVTEKTTEKETEKQTEKTTEKTTEKSTKESKESETKKKKTSKEETTTETTAKKEEKTTEKKESDKNSKEKKNTSEETTKEKNTVVLGGE